MSKIGGATESSLPENEALMNVNEPVTLPAPKLELLQPPSKWEREYAAFKRLLPELLKTHRGKYVAAHEEGMVDCDTDEIALITLNMR
jgi:hypothetical protein